MNTESIKTPVTLEAIAESIGSLSARVDAFEVKVVTRLDNVATKKDLNALEWRVENLETRLNGVMLSIDDLPTRKEFNGLETKMMEGMKDLEEQIDGLAITVNNEFKRVHVRLDEMDEHLVQFEENDHHFDKRLKRLENVMWGLK